MFKKILKKKNLIILAMMLPLYLYFRAGNVYLPIEELAVTSAIGVDVEKNSNEDTEYRVSLLLNNLKPTGEVETQIAEGTAVNYPETRESRQHKLNRKFLLGAEKIALLSEDFAKSGIQSFIDVLFKNPITNDSLYTTVCKDKPEDIYKLKIPGYPNIADYIQGIIDHSNEFNFAPRNYKLIDIYIRDASEGRNIVLPYIEIVGGTPQITGTAIFKGLKMVRKLNNEESKIMNLLRENDIRGIITIQDAPQKYLSFYGKSKRTVRCQRDNGKYTFTINISLSGDIIANTLYNDPMHKEESKNKVREHLSKQTEQQCYDFIEKMQNNYKMDCLELGRIAVAKYGRHTGVDWDEIISKSKIVVNTKVTINSHGRGEY